MKPINILALLFGLISIVCAFTFFTLPTDAFRSDAAVVGLLALTIGLILFTPNYRNHEL